MGGSSGSSSAGIQQTPLSGLSIQSSANGSPVPIVYGTTRVSPNMIWYGDFTPIAHSQKMGGKGGGGAASTSYTYKCNFQFGLCEGPVADVPVVFVGKTSQSPVPMFELFLGQYPQSAWGYLQTLHPDQALSYQGLVVASAGGYDLGNSASLPNHSFVVAGRQILPGHDDADPADIIADLFANPHYGIPSSPDIIGLDQYSAYCRASGLLLSPCYDTQIAAAQLITDLLQITNTGGYFSEGVLKLVPYGDADASGNGATYVPSLDPVAYLTDDDFLSDGDADPVIVKRNSIAQTVSTTADAYNSVTVEYLDRANGYNVSTVTVDDQADIDVHGLRPMDSVSAHQVADSGVAQAVASLILQRAVYVRAQYEFRLGWQFCYLEPTDLVVITDTALGLDLYPVRILSIEEDEYGTLTVLAEDAPLGVFSHVHAPAPSGGGYNVNQAVSPGDTHPPAIFKGPVSITEPGLEVWIAASGGALWGGCDVWVSDDGSSYRMIGSIRDHARHGVLTAGLAAVADPDTTSTLSVQLAGAGQLHAGTHADADLGNTLMWVGGELIAYADAALTAPGCYDLGYLRRGYDQTVVGAHAAGTRFARLDDAVFRYRVPKARIGLPLYVKLTAFNIWGLATQDLADVPAYVYTLDQFALTLPTPLNPTIYCTPDSVGHIGRARVEVSFESVVTNPVTGLDVFVATFPFENAAHISSGGTSSTLVLSGVSSLSSGTLPVLSGSTPTHIVTTTMSAPNDVTWNSGGRYWARLPGGAWTKCTGIDELGYWFNPPHNVAPSVGSTMEWSEITWADERSGEYQLACIVSGAQYEVIRWSTLDDGGPGGAVRVLGCERGVEGTTPINADGATLHYLPALGPGTSVITFPDGAFNRSGTTYTAEIEIDLNIPPGKFVSLAAAVFYELPSGDYARSAIVPAIYGGPL